MGKSVVALAATTSRGLPSPSGPGMAGLEISPSHRLCKQPPGDRALPGLLHVSTGQCDPPFGQTFR